MLSTQLIYGIVGIILFGFSLRFAFSTANFLRQILAINIAGAGLFLTLVAVAYKGIGQVADPIPHALVLTGIVVAFSATALALALSRKLKEKSSNV